MSKPGAWTLGCAGVDRGMFTPNGDSEEMLLNQGSIILPKRVLGFYRPEVRKNAMLM